MTNIIMDKLPMCRICLAQNLRMHYISNTNLQEIYEKLTTMPFQTYDSRPLQVCYICCAKLRKCYKLRVSCLHSEKLFTQMLENNELEPTLLDTINTIKRTERIIHWSSPVAATDPNMNVIVETIKQSSNIPANPQVKVEITATKDSISQQSDGKCFHSEDIHDANNVSSGQTLQSAEQIVVDVCELNIDNEVGETIRVTKPVHDISSRNVDGVGKNSHDNSNKRQDVSSRSVKLVLGRRNLDINTDTSEGVCHNLMLEHNYSKIIRKTFGTLCAPTVKGVRPTPLEEDTQNNNSSNSEIKACYRRSKKHKERQVKHETGIDKKISHMSKKIRFNHIDDLSKQNRARTGCLSKQFRSEMVDLSKKLRGKTADLLKQFRGKTADKPFRCPICARCFNRKAILICHIRTHTGEKPYNCGLCGKQFSRKDILRCHIRIHTGEKPYKCDRCERSFIQKCELAKHIRLHTREKPFKCDICGKRFNEKGNLMKHIRIHTGETPYKCDICGRCFSQKSTLTRHTGTRMCKILGV